MVTLTGGKRKMSPASEGSGNGGDDDGAAGQQPQRLADKLRMIQGQVATLKRMATPPLSPPALASENESAGAGFKDKSENPAATEGPAFTDYSSVPEPCTLEDVLKVNAESASSKEHRDMNEASIRRRGGGKGGKDNGGGRDGGAGKGNGHRGPSSHATFPSKLHDILSRPDMAEVITWLDHGRSWRIVDQTAFIERVMPAYFSQSKIASFMRQVNGWGFVRVMRGKDANSYYSEFFLRGKRSLVRFMERRSAVRDMLGPEPNFSEYGDMPPNPDVDPASLLPLPPVPLPPAPPESALLTVTKTGKIGQPVPLNAWGTPADQWAHQHLSIQQAQLLSGMHNQPQLQPQPQPSQMFLTHQPLQNVPPQQVVLGQVIQQHETSTPKAFLQEVPMQVLSDMKMPPIVAPDAQGSIQMTPPGFQNGTQQEQLAVQNGVAPGTLGHTISPSPQLSPVATPHDISKIPQNDTKLMALMQSGGQHREMQQVIKKQRIQQQKVALSYELMDPTPLPEGKFLRVAPPAHHPFQFEAAQANANASASFTAPMIDPLNADPFVDDDAEGGMTAEMDELDTTGMMMPTSATAEEATGEEDFMFGSLDDIW